MATLRNKRKLVAVTRETQEEHPRNGQSRNTSVSRINEEYITQVFEEIEGKVTKKLSQEFSWTESRILGALSELDGFLLNPQIRTHSGTVPGTFRNTNVENQGTNEDNSQSDPHPEAGIFRRQTTQNSGPEVGHDNFQYCLKVSTEMDIFIALENTVLNMGKKHRQMLIVDHYEIPTKNIFLDFTFKMFVQWILNLNHIFLGQASLRV